MTAQSGDKDSRSLLTCFFVGVKPETRISSCVSSTTNADTFEISMYRRLNISFSSISIGKDGGILHKMRHDKEKYSTAESYHLVFRLCNGKCTLPVPS